MTKPRTLAAVTMTLLAWSALPAQEARKDTHGDPLPPSAIARLGSVRWWVGRDRAAPLVFAPDGKRVLFVVGGAVVILDAATGAVVRRFHKGSDVTTFALSPDGKTLVTAHLAAGMPMRVWGAESGQELRTLPGGRNYVSTLVFSPDGKSLAASIDSEFVVWDAAAWAETRRFRGDGYRVGELFFPPGGREFLSGGGTSDAVRWWDIAKGRESRRGYTGRPRGRDPARLAFSADGSKVAAMSGNNLVQVWDTATAKVAGGLRLEKDQPGWTFCLSPDGKTLATAVALFRRQSQIVFFDSATGKELRRWDTDAATSHLAYSPDGKVLAEATGGYLRLRDAATGKPIPRDRGCVYDLTVKELSRLAWDDNTELVELLLSADGRTLVTAHGPQVRGGEGAEGQPSLRIWDVTGRREKSRFAASWGFYLQFAALSPDGRALAHGDSDAVALWDVEAGAPRGRLVGHRSTVLPLAFSPDGRLLASGSLDQTVLVWDVTGVCPDGKWSPRDLGEKELERLWADLADKDATRAYRAMWSLASAQSAPAFLAARVQPAAVPDEARLKKAIADLDADGFEERRRATTDLAKAGELAAPTLRAALAAKPSEEAKRRLETLLKEIAASQRSREGLRTLRAVEALEHNGTSEARRILAVLAGGAHGATLTEAAAAALARFTSRSAK